MADRAMLEWYTRSGIYTVIDTVTNKIVIQTASYAVANHWRHCVNDCKHPLHYDIFDHDRKVQTWMVKNLMAKRNDKSI